MQASKPEGKFNFAAMNTLPEEFQRIMQKKLGDEYSKFIASLNEPPPVSIRINPRKIAPITFKEQVAWSSYGRYLSSRPNFTLDPLLHAGCYYVQEASSMFLEQAIEQAADLSGSLTVLDLSAAPGGKSTHLLSLLNDKSLLVANEVIRSRSNILAENIQKWGYANVIVTNNDPHDFQALQGFFDVVVVDAPCSGEGLFRKDPDAIEEWSLSQVEHCASRQKRIISDVWPALKKDGIFIYCTCTYNEKENEDNLNWLDEQHGIEFISLQTQKEWGVHEISKGQAKGYRFLPHRANGEGFFISVMRKKDEESSVKIKAKRVLSVNNRTRNSLKSWIQNPEQFSFLPFQDSVYILPAEKINEAQFILENLKIVQAGSTLATIKHEKIIPDHALALSINIQKDNFNTITVDHEQAISYLRRDTIHFPDATKGFNLLVYENIPLGWVNHLESRTNNMYPQEWRIRMALRATDNNSP